MYICLDNFKLVALYMTQYAKKIYFKPLQKNNKSKHNPINVAYSCKVLVNIEKITTKNQTEWQDSIKTHTNIILLYCKDIKIKTTE